MFHTYPLLSVSNYLGKNGGVLTEVGVDLLSFQSFLKTIVLNSVAAAFTADIRVFMSIVK